MRLVRAIFFTVITLIVIYFLDRRTGNFPALGKLLSPGEGIWRNAESRRTGNRVLLSMPLLHEKVDIKYDSLRIPHIFAKNEHDLYYAQGYVTAKDRLWQMDVQVRKASGTLSEILGNATLQQDLYYRRIGLLESATESLTKTMQSPELRTALEAYADGVNAYIRSLSDDQLPLEFKLLDYRPSDWKPVNSILMIKLFAETLAGTSDDYAMTNTMAALGTKATRELFPDTPLTREFAVPEGTKWDFIPDSTPKRMLAVHTPVGNITPFRPHVEGIGSNCWVVSGSRTATGHPILANDPHLTLTYPSIWYQLQLSTEGQNVYGVSIPGIPCIVIGFNKQIGWGLTNVDADVLDWYSVQFRDAGRSEYLYDHRWLPTARRIERIRIRNSPDVLDTIVTTHYGPVIYEKDAIANRKDVYNYEAPEGFAMKWVANDSSQELLTFYNLNKSRDYADFRKALTTFFSPAQNFLYVDNQHIGYVADGHYPIKDRSQGKFLLDGSIASNEWRGYVPMDRVPSALDPKQGFLFSANQSPTDASYPYYINWQFAGAERAARIHSRLAAMNDISSDDMARLQTDNFSVLAAEILDTLLGDLHDRLPNDAFVMACRDSLRVWDRYYDPNSIGATLFTAWWNEFYNSVWEGDLGGDGLQRQFPSREKTVDLILHQPCSPWFDNKRTASKEERADISVLTFSQVVRQLHDEPGGLGKRLEWSRYKDARIDHLFHFPGLGSGYFESGGSSMAINALTRNFGPSWRMVVQAGANMKGTGIYPGGESGNAGSYYYDNFFPIWQSGATREFFFLSDADEKLPGLSGELIFTN